MRSQIVLLAAALALGACGGGGDATTELDLVADDIAFDTSSLSAPSGTITITFENEDEGITHNLQVTGDGVDASTEIVEGPVEQTLTFEAGPGTYDYVCVVHPNEMTGTLEVS